MKRTQTIPTLALICVALAGCTAPGKLAAVNAERSPATRRAEAGANRMLIHAALLTIEVGNVNDAARRAAELTEKAGGYVERRSDSTEKHAHLALRVPAKSWRTAVEALESLGTVTYRHLSSDDVAEQYIDTDARLKNQIALRDRLRQLLKQAKDVKDILAIEKELSRVQTDIDSMQGRLDSLKAQAKLARISLTLKRKQILGPLGYLFQGICWVGEKLFVIRK